MKNKPEVAPQSLSVQDLMNIKNIIDVASQRGAFHVNEYTLVGVTYAKLSEFLDNVPKPVEEPKKEEEEE